MIEKGFAQRSGSIAEPPTQLVVGFRATNMVDLETQINGYICKMLVEIDQMTMCYEPKGDYGGFFSALVTFKDQPLERK